MIQAQILADSINPQGDRITTMKVTFPRIVLAEFNTHRMFSRNSASSRAIPFKKMVQMVRENPFIPIAWQKDHKGMQGKEYFIQPNKIDILRQKWLKARDKMIESALDLAAGIFSLDEVFEFDIDGELIIKQNVVGVTKQIVNRLLEPFMWHTVICTSTEFENFFKLRCPQYKLSTGDVYRSWKDVCKDTDTQEEIYAKDDLLTRLAYYNKGEAEIHISLLAEKMYDALNESTPKQLKAGEWHIPFGDNIDAMQLATFVGHNSFEDLVIKGESKVNPQKEFEELKLKVAVARCARISYQTFGDNPKIDYTADIKLHDMLAANGHASPFEHVAKAMTDKEYEWYGVMKPIETSAWNKNLLEGHIEGELDEGWCRNFKGFIQYRELLENG